MQPRELLGVVTLHLGEYTLKYDFCLVTAPNCFVCVYTLILSDPFDLTDLYIGTLQQKQHILRVGLGKRRFYPISALIEIWCMNSLVKRSRSYIWNPCRYVKVIVPSCGVLR